MSKHNLKLIFDNNGKNNNKVPEDTRLKVFANSYKLTHLKKDVGIKLLDDIIIQNHLPLVFYALNFLKNEHHFRLKNDNNVLQNGDLFMMGVLGLTQATQRYDPSKIYSKNGQIVKFQTYALTRIKGAIIDELRTCNFLPANVMGELSAIEKVEKKFINIHLEFMGIILFILMMLVGLKMFICIRLAQKKLFLLMGVMEIKIRFLFMRIMLFGNQTLLGIGIFILMIFLLME